MSEIIVILTTIAQFFFSVGKNKAKRWIKSYELSHQQL